MTALASNRVLPTFPKDRNVYDLLAAQQVWGGSLVGLTAAGFLVPWDNVATTVFVGVCLEDALEPTFDVGKVDDSGTIVKNIPIASAAQTNVGDQVHCTTDNILTDAVLDGGATSRGVGTIIRFRSATDCDIQLYSHSEFQARYLQGTT